MPTLPKKRPVCLTRSELDRLPRESLHKARNRTKADVYVVEWPPQTGQRVVVKDMRARPLWFRLLVGRCLLRREASILQKLSSVAAVPNLLARPDADALVMEYRAGRPWKKTGRRKITRAVLDELESTVCQVHELGVTHADLHMSNILIDGSKTLSIIDWATGSVYGPNTAGWKRHTVNEMRALDLRALAKIRFIFDRATLSEAQKDLLLREGSKLYVTVRRLRDALQALRRAGRQQHKMTRKRSLREKVATFEAQRKQDFRSS